MDKDNIFCSTKFHMDSDDVLHILVKDLTGTVPDIELYDNEGNVEDTYPVYANSQYGVLYNWYAAADVRNIASVGWHVPTKANFETLMTYLDPGGTGSVNDAGGYLKEMGTDYWAAPNTGATNTTNFNGRGAGFRFHTGGFSNIKWNLRFWNYEEEVLTHAYVSLLMYNVVIFYTTTLGDIKDSLKQYGYSIRLIKDSTTLTHGQTSTYTGNDGKVYATIAIGNPAQEFLSENLVETLYRNLDAIPEVIGNAAWAALVTGAWCYYDNDPNNM